MNFKGKDCVIHVPQCLAGMNECVDNSCKQRAEYLRRSLIIVCRERGQWQPSFIREKLVCFTEVSVMEQILQEFQIPRNLGKTEHAQTVCTRLLSPRPRTSLGTRLIWTHP